MNKFLLLLLVLPTYLFSGEQAANGLLQIDVVIKIVSSESEELWSLDLKKFTVSERAVSINLKGFDGELYATMTPIVLNNDLILLKTSSVVKSIEDGKIIKVSERDLVASFNESITFYPIGNLENIPNIIMELKIKRFYGVNVED